MSVTDDDITCPCLHHFVETENKVAVDRDTCGVVGWCCCSERWWCRIQRKHFHGGKTAHALCYPMSIGIARSHRNHLSLFSNSRHKGGVCCPGNINTITLPVPRNIAKTISISQRMTGSQRFTLHREPRNGHCACRVSVHAATDCEHLALDGLDIPDSAVGEGNQIDGIG